MWDTCTSGWESIHATCKSCATLCPNEIQRPFSRVCHEFCMSVNSHSADKVKRYIQKIFGTFMWLRLFLSVRLLKTLSRKVVKNATQTCESVQLSVNWTAKTKSLVKIFFIYGDNPSCRFNGKSKYSKFNQPSYGICLGIWLT